MEHVDVWILLLVQQLPTICADAIRLVSFGQVLNQNVWLKGNVLAISMVSGVLEAAKIL